MINQAAAEEDEREEKWKEEGISASNAYKKDLKNDSREGERDSRDERSE